jgi:hypothetical protein
LTALDVAGRGGVLAMSTQSTRLGWHLSTCKYRLNSASVIVRVTFVPAMAISCSTSSAHSRTSPLESAAAIEAALDGCGCQGRLSLTSVTASRCQGARRVALGLPGGVGAVNPGRMVEKWCRGYAKATSEAKTVVFKTPGSRLRLSLYRTRFPWTWSGVWCVSRPTSDRPPAPPWTSSSAQRSTPCRLPSSHSVNRCPHR